MHNIRTNFKKILSQCTMILNDVLTSEGNFRQYPRKPKMSDLEIIALSCTMEVLGIDSENYFWSKIQSDYRDQFSNLIDRTRFNRRRKLLSDKLDVVRSFISDVVGSETSTMIVDSIPIPVVKLARERSFTTFKETEGFHPAKGFSAVNRSWFIGYKLHVSLWSNGVVHDLDITPGNVHDIHFVKSRNEWPEEITLLGDRAYISQSMQTSLFDEYAVSLEVPFRTNQKGYQPASKPNRAKRQFIETFFSQLCDQFNLKRNYAKSFRGLRTRIKAKITGTAILSLLNFMNGRKSSQLKHALAIQ